MRFILLIVATFISGIAFAVVPSAIADKPPAPPGQGECSEGNSGNNCTTDPSTNGKDCEPHGNNGGNNENHCLGTTSTSTSTTTSTTGTTETTTTNSTTGTTGTTGTTSTTSTTTRTDTTPTTSTPSGGTGTTESSPTVTSTSTPTVTEPTTSTSVTTTNESDPKPDKAPPLRSRVKARVVKPAAVGSLPFTGLSLWYAVALGLCLISSGLGVLVREYRREQ